MQPRSYFVKVDPLEDQALPTRRQAERVARQFGCTGAHETEEGWLPCESEEAFDTLLTHGIAAYRRRYGKKEAVRPEQKKRVKAGPIPDNVVKAVEKRFGKLTEFDEFHEALVEAFPNAKIGVDDDVTPKQRGGSYAALFKAIEDPETAALVGLLTTGEPNAGIGLSAPLKAPLALVLGDGPSESEGVAEAFHLWAHLAGLAASYQDINPDTINDVQEWVNGRGDDPGVPMATEFDGLIGEEVADDDVSEILMSSFGLDGTAGRLKNGLRAVAARIAVGAALIQRTAERTGDLDEETLADTIAKIDLNPNAANVEMGADLDNEEIERRVR